MNEDRKKKFKLILISITIGSILGILLCCSGELKIERTTKQYRQMKEIVGNRTLIGLSKKEVKEILGEPAKIYTYNEESYMYNAGDIYYYGLFSSQRHHYVLYVKFEETGMAKSTIIKERP